MQSIGRHLILYGGCFSKRRLFADPKTCDYFNWVELGKELVGSPILHELSRGLAVFQLRKFARRTSTRVVGGKISISNLILRNRFLRNWWAEPTSLYTWKNRIN
jgi:hypothetical protein